MIDGFGDCVRLISKKKNFGGLATNYDSDGKSLEDQSLLAERIIIV